MTIEHTDATSLLLDELVHDVASEIASNVNSLGVTHQLDYLLSNGFTLADIEDWLADCQD